MRLRRAAIGFLLFALALLAAIGLLASLSPQVARLVDRSLMRLEQAEHRMRYRAGLPLRGTPDLARLDRRLAERGVSKGAPVLIRIFKQEFELELWMKQGDSFVRFATYPICRWSGKLGPKRAEGDRQAPEGFYTVSEAQLNPNSRWHRAFNLGYPNAFDRAHDRTGSFLMVHGGCGSIGCYAMTNPVIDEIWSLITAAFDKGQQRFQVQVYPFRMNDRAMRIHAGERWHGFWQDLRKGHDLFERTRMPPEVSLCKGRYAFKAGAKGSDGGADMTQRCVPEPATS